MLASQMHLCAHPGSKTYLWQVCGISTFRQLLGLVHIGQRLPGLALPLLCAMLCVQVLGL